MERQTGSKKTDCDFKVRISRKLTGGFKVKVYRPYHNHPASDDHRQHSQYRRPIDEQAQRIESLLKSGVTPRFILNELLKMDPDTLIITQDINNYKHKMRKERLNRKT